MTITYINIFKSLNYIYLIYPFDGYYPIDKIKDKSIFKS